MANSPLISKNESQNLLSKESCKCNICKETFDDIDTLEVHINELHGFERKDDTRECNYQCEVCKKQFNNKGYLENHVKIEHENLKEFKCDICKKFFGAEEYLKRHESRMHSISKKRCECDICHKTFWGLSGLKRHKKHVHNETRDKICPFCNKAFANNKNLQVHAKVVHHKIREYVCDICKKSFSVQCNLKVHKQNVHKEVRDVHCDQCNASFKTDFALGKHVDRMHEITPSLNKCDTCDKTFLSKKHLSFHVQVDHLGKYLDCNFCEETFRNTSTQRHHILLVHENYSRCGDCSKIFKDYETLKIHKQSHRVEKKCTSCEKTFLSDNGLDNHNKLVHENQKMCKSCRKIFPNEETLANHQQNCNKEVVCEVCQKTFKTAFTLRQHKSVTHENYLQCTRCWKYFSDNEKLRIHIQSHEDVKCEYCDKTFTSNSVKIRHVKLTHGHRNYECKKCTKLFSDKDKWEVHQLQCNIKQCSICKKNFKMQKNLNRHMRHVHKIKKIHENDLSCKSCDKKFSYSSLQRIHFKLKHENYTKCKQCKKIFSDNEKLLIHQETHKGEKCEFCGKSFQSLGSFGRYRHINLNHKNYVSCKKCPRIFDTPEKLTIHQQSHAKELSCKSCSKTYTSTKGLRTHSKLVHENYVKCDKCTKLFPDMGKCEVHQMQCSRK